MDQNRCHSSRKTTTLQSADLVRTACGLFTSQRRTKRNDTETHKLLFGILSRACDAYRATMRTFTHP